MNKLKQKTKYQDNVNFKKANVETKEEMKRLPKSLFFLLLFSSFWLILWLSGVYMHMYTLPYLLLGFLILIILGSIVFLLSKPKYIKGWVTILLTFISLIGFWDTVLGFRASKLIHKYDETVDIYSQIPGEFQLNYYVIDPDGNSFEYILKDWEVESVQAISK